MHPLVALALAALLAAPALAFDPSPAASPDLAWSNAASPGGGPVQSVGGAGALLVASHWQGGTYRSTDSGMHWVHVDGFPDVVEARVAWDPTNALRGYVAGFGGVAVTGDGGLTWSHPIVSPASYRIAVSPTGRVAVTARDDNWNNRVMTSADGGATWQDLGAPLPQFTSIYGLAFGRTDAEVVVMSISKYWRTHDGGATWTEGTGMGLDLARTPGGVLWRASAPMQRSDDGGATWVDLDPPGEGNPGTLGAGPAAGMLYAAGSEGLMRTLDGGATWEHLGFEAIAFAATSLVADPADPAALFVTHESMGVLRISPDGQGGWRAEARTAGMPPVDIRALGRSHDGSLLLAGGPLGLWRSRDAGASWQHTGAGIGLQVIWAAAGNSEGTVAYAGGQNAIFNNFLVVSRDGGLTFDGLSFDMGGDSRLVGIATHPAEPGTAWAAVWSELATSRVFETRDAGRTWTKVMDSEPRVFGVAYHAPSATVLVATDAAVMARDPLGAWGPRTVGEARAVASAAGVAYAGGSVMGTWRSLPVDPLAVLLPWADAVPTHLGAAPDGSSVWATTGGRLERCEGPALAGLCEEESPPAGTVQGAMVSADGQKVFAATLGQGVWVAGL